MHLPRFFLPVALIAILVASGLGYASRPATEANTATDARRAESIGSQHPTQNYDGPALWRVADDDTVIYLFGTFHILPAGSESQWFKGPVRRAFEASDVLVTEIITPANPMELAPATVALATDPDGPPLIQKLPPAAREPYRAFVQAQGLRAETYDRFEPWYVASLLATVRYRALGLDPKSGAERVLIAALKPAQQRAALETPQAQLAMLDSVPEQEQIEALVQLVTSKTDPRASIDAMLAHWLKGDAETLAQTKNAALYKLPGMSKIMLYDRNLRWAGWVKQRLTQPGTVFVAVGGSHLAGQNAVQHYLADTYGLKVERVAN